MYKILAATALFLLSPQARLAAQYLFGQVTDVKETALPGAVVVWAWARPAGRASEGGGGEAILAGMPPAAAMSAQIMCQFGAAPGVLVVVPKGAPVNLENKFAATIMDFVPMTNIMPFGICNSPMNPAAVAAKAVGATAPCIPITTPWTPGASKTMINNFPALTATSKCSCTWAPMGISIVNPGTTKEMAN